LTSNAIPALEDVYAEQFPPLVEGVRNRHRVKKMIAAQPNGCVYEKESKSGKALPKDLLG
jgi:hypothetical protein